MVARKKILPILLAVVMVFAMMPIVAGTVYADEPGASGDGITWTSLPGTETISYYLDDKGTLTLQGTGAIPDYSDYGSNITPFFQNSDIKSVVISEEITGIGASTFSGCDALATIVIPKGVKSINNYAFSDCKSLISADLPEGLETIGKGVFAGSGLKSIVVPDTVTVLGENAFDYCLNLKTVKLTSEITEIPPGAFNTCVRLKTIEIPDGVQMIGESAFNDCTNLREITIPESVRVISRGAFIDCVSLEKVTFKGDFSIEMGAFYLCDFTAYYPMHNSTWDEDAVDCGYGGKVKWIGYCDDPKPAAAVKENVKAATVSREGSYDSVVYCSVCGKEISRKTVTIPKLKPAAAKAANPLKISAKTAAVKYSKLKKKAQKLEVTKVITFTSDVKDKKTYTITSANKGKKSFKKYFKVNTTTGKITVKKGLKKGTYKLKVNVTAAGNANYEPMTKTVTVKVKVK